MEPVAPAGPPQAFKIHECSELPSEDIPLQRDAACLAQISQLFEPIQWLGAGAFGIAILLRNKTNGERVVAKMTTFKEMERELRIACELNGLHGETPIFPHTYGWLFCEDIPDEWRAALRWPTDNIVRNHKIWTAIFVDDLPVYYLFMQYVEFHWLNTKDVELWRDHGYRVCLFILLHGIAVARKELGFFHRDVHQDNIMLQSATAGGEVSRFQFGRNEFRVTSRFTPRLMDFGLAVSRSNNRLTYASDDLENLADTFIFRFAKDGAPAAEEFAAFTDLTRSTAWRYARINYMKTDTTAVDFFTSLMEHPYFQIPEIQQNAIPSAAKRQAPPAAFESIERCFTCCISDPMHEITHKRSGQKKYFCGTPCYEAMHGMCRFIK